MPLAELTDYNLLGRHSPLRNSTRRKIIGRMPVVQERDGDASDFNAMADANVNETSWRRIEKRGTGGKGAETDLPLPARCPEIAKWEKIPESKSIALTHYAVQPRLTIPPAMANLPAPAALSLALKDLIVAPSEIAPSGARAARRSSSCAAAARSLHLQPVGKNRGKTRRSKRERNGDRAEYPGDEKPDQPAVEDEHQEGNIASANRQGQMPLSSVEDSPTKQKLGVQSGASEAESRKAYYGLQ